jgi:hypothetical protein
MEKYEIVFNRINGSANQSIKLSNKPEINKMMQFLILLLILVAKADGFLHSQCRSFLTRKLSPLNTRLPLKLQSDNVVQSEPQSPPRIHKTPLVKNIFLARNTTTYDKESLERLLQKEGISLASNEMYRVFNQAIDFGLSANNTQNFNSLGRIFDLYIRTQNVTANDIIVFCGQMKDLSFEKFFEKHPHHKQQYLNKLLELPLQRNDYLYLWKTSTFTYNLEKLGFHWKDLQKNPAAATHYLSFLSSALKRSYENVFGNSTERRVPILNSYVVILLTLGRMDVSWKEFSPELKQYFLLYLKEFMSEFTSTDLTKIIKAWSNMGVTWHDLHISNRDSPSKAIRTTEEPQSAAVVDDNNNEMSINTEMKEEFPFPDIPDPDSSSLFHQLSSTSASDVTIKTIQPTVVSSSFPMAASASPAVANVTADCSPTLHALIVNRLEELLPTFGSLDLYYYLSSIPMNWFYYAGLRNETFKAMEKEFHFALKPVSQSTPRENQLRAKTLATCILNLGNYQVTFRSLAKWQREVIIRAVDKYAVFLDDSEIHQMFYG